jgi:hypothetical protein
VHALTLVAALAVLIAANRHQWFAGDEWDFLARRGLHGAAAGLFTPHNEHWSTAPILVYRLLYSLFGLRSYLPYVVVLLAMHLALAHVLWRLMLRAGTDPFVATALGAVFAVLGAGTENLVWAFQIGFVGSVLLGMVAILLLDHDGPLDALDAAAGAVLVVSLTFSGLSLTMVAVAGLAVLLRRGPTKAALTVAAPAAVYLLWLALAGRHSLATANTGLTTLLGFTGFVWAGLTNAFERSVGLAGAGPVVVLALAVWLLRRSGRASTEATPAYACAMGAVLLFTLIAIGRSSLGADQPAAPRYVYACMALALPAVGLALSDLALTAGAATDGAVTDGAPGDGAPSDGAPGRRARMIAVLAFLALVLLNNLALLREDARRDADLEIVLRRRVLAAAEVVGSSGATDVALRQFTSLPDLTVGALRRMVGESKLPAPTGVTAEDRLAAETFLQVDVGPGTPGSPPPVTSGLAAVGNAGVEPGPESCVKITPQAGERAEVLLTPLGVGSEGPVSVSVASADGGELELFLRTTGAEPVTGPPRTVAVVAGQAVRLDDRVPGTSLVLHTPPTGVTELCGVAPGTA